MVSHRGWLKKTGQDEQHNTDFLLAVDDGFHQKGISRSYTLLDTGQYSGTTDITVNSSTEQKDNACVRDERTGLMWPKELPSATVGASGALYWNDHLTQLTHNGGGGAFTAGLVVVQLNSGAKGLIIYNDSSVNVLGIINVSGTFTTNPSDTISDSGDGGSGGPAQVSAVRTGAKEDIFEYCYQANQASFAGHSDWRVANLFELASLMNLSGTNAQPGTPFDNPGTVVCSSHWGDLHYRAARLYFTTGALAGFSKSYNTGKCVLVRGPDLGARRVCRVLKTGGVQQDLAFACDGFHQAGVAKSFKSLDTGQYSGTTDVTVNSKTHGWDNSCVQDANTGLMWTKDQASGDLGPSSDGKVYWMDEDERNESAWEVVRAANEAALAGHRDWRIPNIFEVLSILVLNGIDWDLDGDYFSNGGSNFWTSTSLPADDTKVFEKGSMGWGSGVTKAQSGGVTSFVRLVRGGATDDDI